MPSSLRLGRVDRIGRRRSGFVRDEGGRLFHFWFDDVCGIESDGSVSFIERVASSVSSEEKWDATISVGDVVRFHPSRRRDGMRKAKGIVLVFDTRSSSRLQRCMISSLVETPFERGGVPKGSFLSKTINTFRHMETQIGIPPTHAQMEDLLVRVGKEHPSCSEFLRREFGWAR